MDRPLLATFNLEIHESAKNYTRSWTSLDTSTAEGEWFLSIGVCSKPEPTFNWNPTNKPMQITSSGTHLSDISTADGTHILPPILLGCTENRSTWKWPRQPSPSARAWNIWRNSCKTFIGTQNCCTSWVHGSADHTRSGSGSPPMILQQSFNLV